MYINRAIEDTVLNISKFFRVLLVTGPRQVGKTTLLQRLAGDKRQYVTLDDPDVRYLAQNDPALFLQRYRPPILIDEIQYAPQILPYIKMEVDRSNEPGEFWLTGSQMFHTMKNVSESLAGRVGIVRLLGLSNSESQGVASEPFTTDGDRLMQRIQTVPRMGLADVYERIFSGGMPELYGENAPAPEPFYSSYVNTYLQRDIRDLTQVADEMAFYNFMTVLAARTAKPVVYEEIAKECGISAPTAKKWMSILVSAQIVALAQPFYHNMLKRIVKIPVLYFLDTGLCAQLLKWDNAATLEKGPMSGAFFENWVFSEIYKSYLNKGLDPPVFYYRDKDKREIDLLLFENGTLYPIEIKKSASPGKGAVKHFHVLNPVTAPEQRDGFSQYKLEIGAGAVVCMSNDVLPIDEKNRYVPAWLI